MDLVDAERSADDGDTSDQVTACDHDGDDPLSPEEAARSRSFVGRLMLGAINLYRMTAPIRRPRCRYLPTCSEYAAEAIEIHGAGRGLWLAVRRLGRCHPFGSFGFDPVPEKKK